MTNRYFYVTCNHMSTKPDADKYRLNNELFTVSYDDFGNKGNGGWHTSHEIFGASHANYSGPIDCLKDLLPRHGCTNIKITEKEI